MSRIRRAAAALTLLLVAGLPSAATGQSLVSSRDSVVTLAIPDAFQHMQLNPVAELQFADTSRAAFFLVIVESKEDLFGWNLTRHSTITLSQVVGATDFPEVSERESRPIGGLPSVQHEIRGAVQGAQIVYLNTTVEGPDHFVQLLGWSVRSQWPSYEPELLDIVESMQIAAAADPSSSTALSLVPGTWVWVSDEDG